MLKILIAEDDRELRQLFSHVLNRHGYTVVGVSNGQEALDAMDADFYEDEIFFCQIRLADIAALDKENRLPHTGYLYVFLHTAEGNWALQPDVRYYDGEPKVAIDDFNAEVPGYEQYNDAWLMTFEETEDAADCNRLLGVPTDWNYPDPPPKLLLQYDPLDSDMNFLDAMDGFLYLFFGEDEGDFGAVTLHAEYT